MHFLFLVSSMHGGGAERVAATLANAWVRRGDQVTLVCCYSGRGHCQQQLDPDVRLVWLADLLRGPAWLRPIHKLLALRRLARELQPDRVLSFLTNVNVTALVALRGLGLPVVVSERTDPAHSVNLEKPLRWLRRWTYPWARQVVVQTPHSLPHLLQVAPRVRRLMAIPNPLPDGLPGVREHEPSAETALDEVGDGLMPVRRPYQLVALGRFSPIKQFDRLIEVFAGLAPAHPDWDLVIYGDGAQRADCLARVQALGLTDRIHLPGYSQTPWADLASAHAFVLNSRVEGFPNALLEAMALGLPCVATDCPSGPAELTQGGQLAALVPLGNEPALAQALARVMQADPAQREAWGRAAAESVRTRFALDAVLAAWDEAWAATPPCDRAQSLMTQADVAVPDDDGLGSQDAGWPGPTAGLQVVHIISGLLHGGAETVLQRLVTAPVQPDAPVRHTVISMTGEGVLGASLRAAGIEVVTLDMQGAWGSLWGLWRLYRRLRAQRPDVVQTWMYHADLLGGLVARLAGVRAVAWGVRNSGVSLAESSRSSRVAAWLCARLSGWVPGVIVACARRAAQVHQGWGYRADRLMVIPNGYDLSVWQPDAAQRAAVRGQWQVPDDVVLLGCVARWNPLKDHANLLAALAISLQKHPQLRCALIGLGMSRDNAALVSQARDLGVLDQLIFLGRRDDVPALMPALDIHVLSSKAEGFPNVVSEAMASGVACVVTDVGDAAEIVGEYGWVVPPGDAMALAHGLDQAIAAVRGPDWGRQRDRARASVARRYGLQAMTDRYAEVWRRLAQDYPGWGQRRGDHRGQAVAGVAETAYVVDAAPRRVLFFITNPAFLVSHRLPVALAARDAGYEVHVASMGGPAVAQLESLGLTHHVLPMSRTSMRPWTEARSLWAVWRLFRRVRPDLVHAVTLKSVLYGGIAARAAQVPAYVAAISGLGYVFIQGTGKRRVLRSLALVLYRLALGHPRSRVIFQNPADRDVLVQAGAVRPTQVVMLRGSGVDLGRFSPAPWPDGPITVAMASRLLHDKGVREFIEAARLSAARGEALRWCLAGSLDLDNPASVQPAELQAWQAEGIVDYVGECPDVAGFYAQAHIVTLPSYREGLPKSLIEAAACGRPVVTTDVPGCRDVIEPNVSGLLVPVRDAQALADAIGRLARDAELRMQMGAAGRALAERDYGLQSIVQGHLAVYGELLGR